MGAIPSVASQFAALYKANCMFELIFMPLTEIFAVCDSTAWQIKYILFNRKKYSQVHLGGQRDQGGLFVPVDIRNKQVRGFANQSENAVVHLIPDSHHKTTGKNNKGSSGEWLNKHLVKITQDQMCPINMIVMNKFVFLKEKFISFNFQHFFCEVKWKLHEK